MTIVVDGAVHATAAQAARRMDEVRLLLERREPGTAVRMPSSVPGALYLVAAARDIGASVLVGTTPEGHPAPTHVRIEEHAGAFGLSAVHRTSDVGLEDCAAAMWTSGTSGNRSLVLHRQEAMTYQSVATAERMALRSPRLGLALPLDHAYGFSVANIWLDQGGELHWYPMSSVKGIVRGIARRTFSSFDTIASVWMYVLRYAQRNEDVLRGLRELDVRGVGGQVLDPRLDAAFRDVGAPLHDGYGFTEAGPNVAINVGDGYRAGTVGLPLDGTRVCVEDGELLVASPSVSDRLWTKSGIERSTRVIHGGWFRSGDAATLDKGRVIVHGRLDDIVQQFAEKASLEILEAHLRDGFPDDGAVQVVVVGRDVSGDRLAALVSGPDGLRDELIARVRINLRELPRPFTVSEVRWLGEGAPRAGGLRKLDRAWGREVAREEAMSRVHS